MKKALVLTLVLVLGLSLSLVAQTIGGDFVVGDLSGSWNTEFSIGYEDVVITDPGFSFTIDGATYPVTQGTVTIASQVISGTYSGSTYDVTVPGGTYTVGPWNITVPEVTLPVTAGSVTVAEQIIPVQLPDGSVSVTLPAYTFTIPDFTNKACLVQYTADPAVAPATATWQYGGIEDYVVDTPGAGAGAPADSDSGVTTVPIENGALGAFDWCTLEFAVSSASITATPFDRSFQVPIVSGLVETLVFTFVPAAYAPIHNDLVNGLTITLVSSASVPALDSLNRAWTATITIPLNFVVTNPILTIAAGTEIGTCVYDNKTLTFETSTAIVATAVMPAGWPLAAGTFTSPCGVPTVTFGYDNQGWVYEGTDLLAPALLDFGSETYNVVGGAISVDVAVAALFATLEDGVQNVTLPARTLVGTYTGGTVDITVPAQILTVSAQSVTIPAFSFVVPADSIVIPPYSFSIIVEDQTINMTVAGGTYNVSAQTVTIPAQPIIIEGWTQTLEDIVTLGVESTLTVDYVIGGWTFGSVLVVDETGMTALDFSAGGALGAFSFSSSLGFDPALVAFEKWNVVSGVSIAGVTFGANFTLIPNNVTLVLSGLGVSGDVSVGADITFGVAGNEECDLNWAGIVITAGFPFVCADIAATLTFDCEGFSSIMFEADGIAVQSFPWLTIDADLTFTTAAKTLVISPDFSFGTGVCFDLYMDLGYSGSGPLTIEGFTIYGIKIVGIFNGVTFTGLSSFDEVNYNLVMNPYWEVYTIATTDDGCCGPFAFDVSLYFLEGGVRLFDIAYLEANVSLQVASQLEFTTGVELDINDETFTLWTIGLNVDW